MRTGSIALGTPKHIPLKQCNKNENKKNHFCGGVPTPFIREKYSHWNKYLYSRFECSVIWLLSCRQYLMPQNLSEYPLCYFRYAIVSFHPIIMSTRLFFRRRYRLRSHKYETWQHAGIQSQFWLFVIWGSAFELFRRRIGDLSLFWWGK